MNNYYDLCCQHRGKVVSIFEKNGLIHEGRIVDVNREYVFLERTRGNGIGGFAYGYGGWYGGHYGYPFYGRNIVPIALAAIGGFILGAVFW